MTEITNKDFNSEVLECDMPVFACFTAERCYACYPTCLVFDELANDYDGSIKFVRLDVEKNPDLAERYRTVAVPTILIFKNSEVVKKLIGFQEREDLRKLLDGLVG